VPLLTLSKGWGIEEGRGPSFHMHQWRGRDERERLLYARWISAASMTLDDARTAFAARMMPSGMPGLPGDFFRHPFIRVRDHLVCLSPWHARDYAVYGTWGKLNAASKALLKTKSNQAFSSAFGDSFEAWCASVAREAADIGGFQGALLLPTAPGAHDEVEDVVLMEGDMVAMFSSKASVVPETSLKTAERRSDVIDWLERFFFEDRSGARQRGYRGGAAILLDEKIKKLRAGLFEDRGLRRDALVLPCIVSFDNVGESGLLYRWLDEEYRRRRAHDEVPFAAHGDGLQPRTRRKRPRDARSHLQVRGGARHEREAASHCDEPTPWTHSGDDAPGAHAARDRKNGRKGRDRVRIVMARAIPCSS